MYKRKKTRQWKSTTKQFTLTSIFNEAFRFDLRNINIQEVTLDVCVISYDRFAKDEEIGRIQIGSEVDHETGSHHWKQVLAQPQNRISHWHAFAPVISKRLSL